VPSRLYTSDFFSTFKSRLEAIPMQALLLSSPADPEIETTVRRHAGEIQEISGDSIVVMVPIDSSAAWVREYGGLPSVPWERSPAAWTLLGQFVSLAGVRWDELPALVVGRSVFSGPRLVMSTSSAHLLDQLRALAVVVRDKGRGPLAPNIRRVLRASVPEQFLRSRTVTTRVSADIVDSALASLAGVIAHGEPPPYREPLEMASRRESTSPSFDDVSHSRAFREVEGVAFQRASRDEAKPRRRTLRARRVTEVAQAAKRSVQQAPVLSPALESVVMQLDDAGRSFLLTALSVATMLGDLGFEADYGAAGLPLCNLFERQLNLAPVQIARSSRGVPMPERYVRFDPGLPAGRAVVDTSISEPLRHVDINQFDPDSPLGYHRFLTVGESRHLLRVMIQDRELRGLTHIDEIASLEDVARKVGAIRNRHAHTVPMSREAWMRLRELVLDSGILKSLVEMAGPLRI